MLLIVPTSSLKMFCFNKCNLNIIKCICFAWIYGQALVEVAVKNGHLLVSALAQVQFVIFNSIHSHGSSFYLFTNNNPTAITPHSVERYDPSKDAWEMVAPMADKRINFGVGVMLGFIFVVGGHNGVSHLSSIERYDPHQNQWTVCRPMNEPRTGEFLGEVELKTEVEMK